MIRSRSAQFAISLLSFVAIIASGCKDNTAPIDTSCDVTFTLTLGVAAAGSLQPGDCIRQDQSRVDYYTLVIATAAEIQIDLTSTAFDAWLEIEDSDGEQIDADDDTGGDQNARIVVTLQPGTYTVLANSFSAGETGAYTLLAAVVVP